jgi:hypothetical protein
VSLADEIYNSIPKTYLQSLHIMQERRAQYSSQRRLIAHPKVTKVAFMHYLNRVHQNDVAFLKKIGDLKVPDDEWPGRIRALFD